MSWQKGALIEFETERFNLRSMTREDVTNDYLAWLADPEVMVGLNLPRKRLTRAQAVRYVLSFDNQRSFIVLVSDRKTGDKVGFYTMLVDEVSFRSGDCCGHRGA